MNQPLTPKITKNYFSWPGLTEVKPAPQRILEAVCRAYGVSESEIRQKANFRTIVEPRQVAMFIIRRKTGLSLMEIGRFFDKDHATVMWAIKQVNNSIDSPHEETGRRVLKIMSELAY